MPTAAVIATHVPVTRSLSLFVGSRDLTNSVQWDSLQIQDAGPDANGTTSFRINAAIADLPEVYDQAFVQIIDHDASQTAFSGFVVSRKPTSVPGFSATDITANDIGRLLDDTWVPSVERAAETMQARIGHFWAYYGSGALSGDLTHVASIGGTLPAAAYVGMTLRRALTQIIAQASATAEWYVDMAGRLHVYTSESNDAPFNIDADAPGAGEIAPQELTVNYESASYANRVYVQGATPAASGFFSDSAAIAAANGLVRTESISASDCETAAMALAIGSMYLGKVSSSKPRGTFRVTSPDVGFHTGQNVLITSADHGLSAESFKIARVTTRVVKPGTDLKVQQDVEFGGARAGSASGSIQPSGVGQLVSGQLGGASNVYVTADGLSVTDTTRVRCHIGRLANGSYGITITDSSGNVLIDGQKIQLSQSEGTIPAGVALGIPQTTVTASGLKVTTGGNDRVIAGDIGGGIYGLKVVSTDGATVIIDGTKNILRVVATGTINITGPNGTAATAASVVGNTTIATGLGYHPAFLQFLDDGAGFATGLPFGAFWNSGADSGKAARNLWGYTDVVPTNQTKIEFAWQAWFNDSGNTWGFRYYIIEVIVF